MGPLFKKIAIATVGTLVAAPIVANLAARAVPDQAAPVPANAVAIPAPAAPAAPIVQGAVVAMKPGMTYSAIPQAGLAIANGVDPVPTFDPIPMTAQLPAVPQQAAAAPLPQLPMPEQLTRMSNSKAPPPPMHTENVRPPAESVLPATDRIKKF
jgi:hypothetical protein